MTQKYTGNICRTFLHYNMCDAFESFEIYKKIYLFIRRFQGQRISNSKFSTL